MGIAIFIVPERKPEGLDIFVNGKAMAQVGDEAWDQLCRSAGTRTVNDYVSMNPEELADLMDGEQGRETPEALPPEQWFDAAEGLAWTNAVTSHLRANPQAIQHSAGVLEDLGDCERVFEGLLAHGIRWHVQIDF